MVATASYQAGFESTNTAMSYAPEATWATAPATTFQQMRINSESMKHVKTRTRPPEIRGDRQSAPAVTTQEAASGQIVMPMYAATVGAGASPFEDLLACVMGADWAQADGAVITGVAGDIALAGSGALTSTTAGKFTGIVLGQVIKLRGFTNAANNAFVRVTSVVSATSLVVSALNGGTLVTETPAGAAAAISYSGIRNGTIFKSIFMQQRLNNAGSMWFRYAGSYPTHLALSLQLQQYATATFDILAQQELKGTVDASTGGIIAAPGTRDIDPVAGFKNVLWNGAALGSSVDQISLDLNNTGAAAQYALGTSLAVGMTQGTLIGMAKFNAYFRDSTLYDAFRAETSAPFSFQLGDIAGNQWVFSAPNATLMLDQGVPVTGPDKALMQAFTVEFNPDPVTGYTIAVDRFLAGS